MTVITEGPALGGQIYPFLHGHEWSITTSAIGDQAAVQEAKAAKDVSLRWVKDDKIVDLRLGKFPTYQEALRILGLELSLKKGGFVLSKRISRLMRPYFFYGFFDQVDIHYDAGLDAKTWDGAAQIDQAFLKRLTTHVDSAKGRELLSCGRVELTVQSSRGQDKGHALVVPSLGHDLILPLDTKPEVKLVSGQIFIGVQPVHAKDSRWLDVQSMINLRPFLRTEHLLPWLRDMGDQFLADIETGKLDAILSTISSIEEIENWPIREYLASGGQAMWFKSVVKQLSSHFIRKVKARGLGKLRTPIPGGYYYLFADAIGDRQIPKGQIELDKAHATAWISREDWIEASRILGGADQDDALSILPFRDWDSDLKVLVWRSPNQLGEYMIFLPKEDIEWAQWPELDSRQLPARIDARTTEYQNLVKLATYHDQPYSIQAMNRTVTAAQRNIAGVGWSVNLQMTLKAMTGALPNTLPARLEEIVDAQVKTGADLSAVQHWNKAYARAFFAGHLRVPAALQHRILSLLPEHLQEQVTPTTDHWLDDLISQVQTYLHAFQAQRDVLVQQCMPPWAVFAYGRHHVKQGALLKTAYGTAIGQIDGLPKEADFETARVASENVLKRFPVSEWKQILAGAAVRTYVYGDQEGTTSDAVLWQYGPKVDGQRQRGIVHLTLAMLREAGVISELVETTQGIVRYYDQDAEVGIPVEINGAWMNYAQAILARRGQPVPTKMAEVSKGDRLYFKGLMSEWAEAGKFDGQPLYIRTEDWNGKLRKSAWRNEKRIGFIQPAHEQRVGETLTPRMTLAEDGNLLVVGMP